MGRHTLSTTALAHQLISHLKPLSEMLPLNERLIVEKFFDTILQQRVAISEATDLMPLEATLVILLADERRRNNQEIDAVYQELQKLKDEIERLKSGS